VLASSEDFRGVGWLAEEPPTVTSGVIWLIVEAGTPAFDRSPTEEYGRPAIIFFAVASPTRGNSSNSPALAVFRSIGVPGADDDADRPLDFVPALAFVPVFDLTLAVAGAGPPTVTSGVIFLMVDADTPAFDRSSIDEYGRPAIIFLAVAGPTPGKLSKSFSLALFRSTLFVASALFDCLAVVALADREPDKPRTAITIATNTHLWIFATLEISRLDKRLNIFTPETLPTVNDAVSSLSTLPIEAFLSVSSVHAAAPAS
jgi:hypothetical protein